MNMMLDLSQHHPVCGNKDLFTASETRAQVTDRLRVPVDCDIELGDNLLLEGIPETYTEVGKVCSKKKDAESERSSCPAA